MGATKISAGALRAEATERLTAELSTATGEVERLRAALVEAHNDAAALLAIMPVEVVVPCPSCGVDITADLDDDASGSAPNDGALQ